MLQAFTPSIRSHLPFHLPSVAGSVAQGEPHLRVLPPARCHAQPGGAAAAERPPRAALRASFPSAAPRADRRADRPGPGRAALAARALVMDTDLPAYGAEQCRKRMLHDLDRAATTGQIPASCCAAGRRPWRSATLWQFSTRVVRGDLHEDNITVDHGSLASFTGWSGLTSGSPPRSFSWLVGMSDSAFADTVLEAYSVAAVQPPDRHLLRRAHLKARVPARWPSGWCAAWTGTSVHRGADARRMLDTLARDVRASGFPLPESRSADDPLPSGADFERPGPAATGARARGRVRARRGSRR
ncbi:hypothetical protein QJS66_22445 [Kocuria rhizophila]|nr:hypothetical protein QJS66_22445 [Kocuria rhizophila]